MSNQRALSRRELLRGAGVALSLPLLGAMRPAFAEEAKQKARRLTLAICNNLGLLSEHFFPQETGFGYHLRFAWPGLQCFFKLTLRRSSCLPNNPRLWSAIGSKSSAPEMPTPSWRTTPKTARCNPPVKGLEAIRALIVPSSPVPSLKFTASNYCVSEGEFACLWTNEERWKSGLDTKPEHRPCRRAPIAIGRTGVDVGTCRSNS